MRVFRLRKALFYAGFRLLKRKALCAKGLRACREPSKIKGFQKPSIYAGLRSVCKPLILLAFPDPPSLILCGFRVFVLYVNTRLGSEILYHIVMQFVKRFLKNFFQKNFPKSIDNLCNIVYNDIIKKGTKQGEGSKLPRQSALLVPNIRGFVENNGALKRKLTPDGNLEKFKKIIKKG